jgi:hypothetical protein
MAGMPCDNERFAAFSFVTRTQHNKNGGLYMTREQIERNFTYHPPKPGTPEIYSSIRSTAKAFAELIQDCCPDGRERDLAHAKLEETVMWANAAVARNVDG